VESHGKYKRPINFNSMTWIKAWRPGIPQKAGA
jgi:hypothetical protein